MQMQNWCYRFTLASLLVLAGALAFSSNCAVAQIVPDRTLPSNSSVTTQDNIRIITGGTHAGSNLFHSFQEFSVPTGSTAYFNNGLDIQNIISRVTGKSISNIDGLIKSNGTANLFFMNPNGIIFGQNARLDIGGSFIGSTASSLKFADGFEFSATNPQSTSVLTISVPIGLQYGANPGRIHLTGDGQGRRILTLNSPIIDTTNALRVHPNQTLALVGGDISLEGATFKTAGGRIELGSVSGEGLVSLTPINKGFSLGYDAVQNFGNIQLFQKTTVDASGAGSGDIQVTGRRVTLTDGSQIETSTLGADRGGAMVVNAVELIEAVGSPNSGQDTGLFAASYPGATGTGGSLTINTRDLLVRGAQIFTGTFGSGKGGNVTINATNSVQFTNTLPNSPIYGLSSAAIGATTGDAGDVTINTRDLLVRDGGYISAKTFGSAKGGNITINATNSVQVIGTSADGRFGSGLFTQSQPSTTGDGGNLTINTGELLVRDRGIVAVRSEGTGKAGNLNVNARSIRLDNNATLTADTPSNSIDPSKEQATITLRSSDLILRRNSTITTNATGTNVIGGNINIDTDVLAAFENSDISANSIDFRGGKVTINATGIFGTQFRNAPTLGSDITATGASPQLSGSVEINVLEIDPSGGLTNLPVEPQEPKLAQSCNPNVAQNQSEFIITGRGGIPPNPREILRSNVVHVDWVALDSDAESRSTSVESQDAQQQRNPGNNPRNAKNAKILETEIVEAQGWVVDAKGDIFLVAQPSNAIPHSSSWLTPVACFH